VILINLLPHRAEKRRQRRQAFYVGIGIAAGAGLAIVAVWFSAVQQLVSTQESRNAMLKAEITRVDAQIKDVANLRAEIEALKARQRAVEDLQADRNMPVHLLGELVRQTPEGVYLTGMRQNAEVVTLTGIAQTNERVSEFLRNVQNNSPWLEKPDLVEIKAVSSTGPNRDQRRVFDFTMRVTLKRAPTPAAAIPAAAGAPAPAAAAKSP
jgi:type IV pilus assembly protein PilN